jgi:hypothetical protein
MSLSNCDSYQTQGTDYAQAKPLRGSSSSAIIQENSAIGSLARALDHFRFSVSQLRWKFR